jgi:hypothetical protein
MKWFRKGPSPHQTALAMVGAKAGDRVVIVGTDDPGLAAELACLTGLNGQTVVVGPAAAGSLIETAAAKAGALIEMAETLPSARIRAVEGFDIAVWIADLAAVDEDGRRRSVLLLLDALRPGGRVIVLDRGRKAGLLGGRQAPVTPGAEVVAMLTRAGAIAARELATAEGVTYFEARKSR